MITHGKNIKIFAANASVALASQISDALGLPLGKSEVKNFSDGEIYVSINETVRGSDVFVVQSTCHPVNNHIMELLIMIDAFKRASAGRITAVIPYFGYARQDRKAKSRDPISAKLVADLIATAGADRVLTMDLHAPQIQGFFNIPVDHLLGVPLLVPYFANRYRAKESRENLVIVSPDLGSVTRARNFAQKLDVPIAIVDKRRQRANNSELMNIIGDVRDKGADYRRRHDRHGRVPRRRRKGAQGDRRRALHPRLRHPRRAFRLRHPEDSGKLHRGSYPARHHPLAPEKKIDKITCLNTAEVFAEAIERIYEDLPISSLFN